MTQKSEQSDKNFGRRKGDKTRMLHIGKRIAQLQKIMNSEIDALFEEAGITREE
ncbi:hypothetical protein LCGC14_2882150 [marine sediment metagenome]|uniref:Uncharacterized protein n=1 Tax=marine sediment metagenome TaxID=412755 RepID=A0A0F8Y013_9ZZZZ